MLPYRLLFNIGSKAVGTFMQRRKEKSAQPENGTFKFPNVFDALRFIF